MELYIKSLWSLKKETSNLTFLKNAFVRPSLVYKSTFYFQELNFKLFFQVETLKNTGLLILLQHQVKASKDKVTQCRERYRLPRKGARYF